MAVITAVITAQIMAVADLDIVDLAAAVAVVAVNVHAIIAAKKMRIHAVSMMTADILKIATVAQDNLKKF
ncbi:MAG: hypothetical protein RR806_00855 [Oscillospiraceae bacterium]